MIKKRLMIISFPLIAFFGCSNSSEPTMPVPPIDGEQEIVELPENSVNCISEVKTTLSQWAKINELNLKQNYESQFALDIEFVFDKKKSEIYGKVKNFEKTCILFHDRFETNEKQKELLRQYLVEIKMDYSLIFEHDLIPRGLSFYHVHHLKDHLKYWSNYDSAHEHYYEQHYRYHLRHWSNHKHNNQYGISTIDSEKTSTPMYTGIRYFRVTYSIKPNYEYSITTGLLPKYSMTLNQRSIQNELKIRLDAASKCEETQ